MRTVQRSILDARRWLCLFMVCCIILCGIGGIHQRAQALVGVDDALVAVVIAALAAMGISFVSTGAYNSLNSYVGSLIDQYASSSGTSIVDMTRGCNAGANNIGQLLLNNRYVVLVEGFAAWLRATFSLTDNSTITILSPGTEINGLTMYTLPIAWASGSNGANPSYEWTIISADSTVYCLFGTGSSSQLLIQATARFFSQSQATLHRSRINTSGTVNNYTYTMNPTANTHYTLFDYYYVSTDPVNFNTDFTVYPFDDWYPILTSEENIEEVLSSERIDINTGTISLPSEGSSYASGDGAVIDLQLPWGVTYPDIVSQWIPAEWTNTMSGDPTIAYEAATTVESQVSTTSETSYVSSDAGDYQTPGLKDVFPFCLPFDVYNFLNCLAADPVAPSFTWRFYVPRLCDETFTVDLAPFDTVAQIVRTMELLAFCIGLAYVTRERFIRG